MKFLDAEFVQGFMRMATDGWDQGWHERNGGNLSYRMRPEEVEQFRAFFRNDEPWREIGTEVPELKNEYFMVTGSGKYMRNVSLDFEDSVAVIRVDETGTKYQIVWGLVNGGKPTSELPSHLMNLEVLKQRDPEMRIVYHAHPANIVALTFVLPLTDEVFTREIWEMETECPVVFPQGIGVVEWMVPGGKEIGAKTSEIMKTKNVAVWAHHGMFVCGHDFDETFGLMHTVEKSAEILVKVMSMTNVKRNTIRPDDFRALQGPFGISLDERFLYEKQSDVIGEK